MRLRWLLIALVTLTPSLASTCPPPALTIHMKPGLHAGTLSILATELGPSEGGLVVELSNATLTRTLRFRSFDTHFESLDLDPVTSDLAPGEYGVVVRWGEHVAQTKTFVPYRCGLTYQPPKPPAPSKLPYLLTGLAFAGFVVALRLRKRAGSDQSHVPCCWA